MSTNVRDRDQIEFEIRYSIRLMTRQSRFYARIDALLVFLTLLGSSSAVGAFFTNMPSLAGFAGFVLIATTITQFVVKPAEKSIYSKEAKKRYANLLSQSQSLDDPKLDSLLWQAHGKDIDDIKSLNTIAYNDVLLELGREGKNGQHLQDLTLFQKVVAFLG